MQRIAQDERRYSERQCRWLIRQHSRAQSSVRKFVEESMAADAEDELGPEENANERPDEFSSESVWGRDRAP